MRDHSNHIELSREDAVKTMLGELESASFLSDFQKRKERISVNEAYGRTLAQDVLAKVDAPDVLTCAMDSIAVHWSDFEGLAEDEVPDTSNWVRGEQWQFANTGVAMPEGFDTAIVIEHVRVSDDEQHVEVMCSPSKRYAGTREVGSTMHAGDMVVEKGALIDPDIAARIVSAGHSSIDVIAKPRISFLPTGDELVPANLPYSTDAPNRYAGRGHVFESNSAVVHGKVDAWGGKNVPFDIVPDVKEAIRNTLEEAMQVSDVIILNAGSSKGSDDWSVEILEDMGKIICHQTNHGPGHHSSYAILENDGRLVPVVGISGPAGGASFTLDFYLRPIMLAMLGHDPYPKHLPCKLAASFGENKFAKMMNKPKRAGEDRPPEATDPDSKFFAVKFIDITVDSDGTLLATPIQGRPGSPATLKANGIFMLPAGPAAKPPEVGSIIDVELRFGYRLV